MKIAPQMRSFPKGGIHPQELKLSANRPIEYLPPPSTVIIPVAQHLGLAATPIVHVGDKVKIGQVIAQASGMISTNIHATVAGSVTKIEKHMDVSGYKRLCVFINNEDEQWVDGVDLSRNLKTTIALDGQEIIKKVKLDGLAGMGGAAFPLHVKLSLPKGKQADVLLINGVECEPYLTADHRLMLERGPEIMVGIKILMKALNVSKALIGIEANKSDAITHMLKLTKDFDQINVIPLEVKYPQGAEKQLVEAMINRQVPTGGLPIDVGCVVQNVGTAFATYESIQKNKPLIERVVTVAGDSLKRSSNFLVRLGTPIAHLIDTAGGLPNDTGKVICGGPMMGKALNTLDVPIVKGSSGILVLPKNVTKRAPVLPCIRCARCIKHCPLGLEPFLIMNLVEKARYDEAGQEDMMNCCECGSCAYVCPAKRPLLDSIRLGKSFITQQLREKAP